MNVGNPKKRIVGRPKNEEQIIAFQKTCKYFEENDEEQFTINELAEIMQSYLKNSKIPAYDRTHIKAKLIEQHYGEEIVITSGEGKSSLVTLR